MSWLRAHQIQKSFQPPARRLGQLLRAKPSPQRAFPPLSLEIRANERIYLEGPNGAGKTTLLRVLAGILKPDGGTLETRVGISALFPEGFGFNGEFEAKENLDFVSRLRRETLTPPHREAVLAFADVPLHRPYKYFSQGQQLRLAVAYALLSESGILLFDEVFPKLDRAFQEKSFHFLLEKGKSAVFTSHGGFHFRCDRFWRLCEKGLIQESFSARDSMRAKSASTVLSEERF